MYNLHIQGDQLNMAVFFSPCKKVTCPVKTTVHVYTGQVNFSKVLEKQGYI